MVPHMTSTSATADVITVDIASSPIRPQQESHDPQQSNSEVPNGWKNKLWGDGRVSRSFANNTGLLLVVASQFFFAVVNLAVKTLNSLDPPVPVLELIVIRMATTLICCITYMLIAKIPDPFLGPKEVRGFLLIRGFSGFVGLFGVYYSLQYLSLSDATVLTFLSPITTAIAGALLLKERFTWPQAFSGVFSLVGVILIARPTFIFGDVGGIEKGTPAERLGAVGVALVGVLGATGAYTTIKAIGKHAHPLHLLVAFSTVCVITGGAVILKEPTSIILPTRWEFLLLLILIGIFGFVAQTLLVMGLQRETASRGVLGVYFQIIFATILERVFFHSKPSILSVIGSAIILTSAIYVALAKTNTPTQGKPHYRPITTQDRIEDLEETARMEQGLLNGVDRTASYTKL